MIDNQKPTASNSGSITSGERYAVLTDLAGQSPSAARWSDRDVVRIVTGDTEIYWNGKWPTPLTSRTSRLATRGSLSPCGRSRPTMSQRPDAPDLYAWSRRWQAIQRRLCRTGRRYTDEQREVPGA